MTRIIKLGAVLCICLCILGCSDTSQTNTSMQNEDYSDTEDFNISGGERVVGNSITEEDLKSFLNREVFAFKDTQDGLNEYSIKASGVFNLSREFYTYDTFVNDLKYADLIDQFEDESYIYSEISEDKSEVIILWKFNVEDISVEADILICEKIDFPIILEYSIDSANGGYTATPYNQLINGPWGEEVALTNNDISFSVVITAICESYIPEVNSNLASDVVSENVENDPLSTLKIRTDWYDNGIFNTFFEELYDENYSWEYVGSSYGYFCVSEYDFTDFDVYKVSDEKIYMVPINTPAPAPTVYEYSSDGGLMHVWSY